MQAMVNCTVNKNEAAIPAPIPPLTSQYLFSPLFIPGLCSQAGAPAGLLKLRGCSHATYVNCLVTYCNLLWYNYIEWVWTLTPDIQMLVPKSCREMLFHVTYINPMACHFTWYIPLPQQMLKICHTGYVFAKQFAQGPGLTALVIDASNYSILFHPTKQTQSKQCP